MTTFSATHRTPLVLACGLLVTLLSLAGAPPADAQTVEDYLSKADPAQIVEAATAGQRKAIWEDVGELYAARDHQRLWTGRRGLNRQGKRALEAVRTADEHGLLPQHYRLDEIARLDQGRTSGDDLLRLDVEVSAALLHLGAHLLNGRVSPAEVEKAWRTEPRTDDLAALLGDSLGSKDPARAFLDRVVPPHEPYRRLQGELARYRRLADQGGWKPVPEGEVLEAGDSAPAARLLALAQRLTVEGDLDASAAESLRSELSNGQTGTYGEALSEGVERFQERNGIVVDGVLGPDTLATLNVTAEQRVRQIIYNLERWRWLPADFGERNIQVNIASQRLEAYEGGEVVLEMAVVVGRDDWETPVFTDRMEHVVINPYWNVPVSIVKADILPKARNNPSYIRQQNFEVLNASGKAVDPSSVNWASVSPGAYRIRQKPGPGNALGTIKFIFPNDHNVYLHDTPSEAAFDQDKRALSHGCVRVERPLDVAGFVFANQKGWDKAKVQQVMDSRKHTVVQLDERLPVYLLYWTAFVDDGRIRFRQDIYGHDKALGKALDKWLEKLPKISGDRSAR
jgi:L,D-transpeptidase YcbB